MTNLPEGEYLTVKEVRAHLIDTFYMDFSLSSIYNWIYIGKLQSIKTGGSVKIRI